MTTYYFDISEASINSISVEDFEAFERARDGDFKMYLLRPAICRFMADEKGRQIDFDIALKITSKFSMNEMKSFVEQFFNSMKNTAVPNVNSSPSI